MSLKIISKTGCPYCVKMKDLLSSNNLKFEEVVLDDLEERQKFYSKWSVNTVPQLFQNGIRLGGFSDCESKIQEIVINETNNSMQYSTVYKPFYAPWAVELAKVHEKIHWVEEEADLSEDVNQWKGNGLSKEEKSFITDVLRLFTQSDVIVGQNYYDYLIPKFKNNEIRNMLGSFAAREAIHQRAYALLTDTLGLPDSEYSAFREYKEMKDKADYMLKNDNSSLKGLGLCLAKSVFSEGVLLFASFAMLLNFQRFGKMKGMGKIVEWSQRDESAHVKGISQLFQLFCEEHPNIVNDSFKKSIYEMARKIVELEDSFIDVTFDKFNGKTFEGFSREELKQYIRYIADRRLLQLGLKPNYGIQDNPLPWIDWIMNGTDKSNFFETRVSEYSVGGMTGEFSYDFCSN